jgi:hypothetical protein
VRVARRCWSARSRSAFSACEAYCSAVWRAVLASAGSLIRSAMAEHSCALARRCAGSDIRVSIRLFIWAGEHPLLIAGYAASLTRYRTTIPLMYGSTHFGTKSCRWEVDLAGATSRPPPGVGYCRVQAGGLVALIRRASLTSSLTAPVMGSASPAASVMPPTICISFKAQVKLV